MTTRDKIAHADLEKINKIREKDPTTLRAVYKEIYPMVEKYVMENSGSKDDARDVFQDAMYILIKKLSNEGFELSSKLSTYLYAVGKNLWLRKLTKKDLNAGEYAAEIKAADFEDDEHERLMRVKNMKVGLERLGEPCKSILIEFYFNQKSMKEIAEMFHYSNPDNAKNQKYKCLMRLKKLVGNRNAK